MCRGCERWFRNPQWVPAEPESAELLSLCVKRIKGLKSVRLLNAEWVWTEPHSRRLKVKLTVARDVLSGSSVTQSLLVEFAVSARHCDKCARISQKQTWAAKVQLRQRAEHPRTLLAIEQHLMRQRAALVAVEISRAKEARGRGHVLCCLGLLRRRPETRGS